MNELENALLAHNLTNKDGSVRAPKCCGVSMLDDGECSEGCCDDYLCSRCHKRLRIQWPD